MGRLLRDRFYEYAPDRAWDLATGQAVDVTAPAADPPPRDAKVAPLLEVLDHGREGAPRWIVTDMTTTRGWMATVRTAAEDARSRGFVPIDVDLYLRIRTLADEELRDRALVLIARPGMAVEHARRALVDAATRSPRPHVLLTFRLSTGLEASPPGNDTWERRSEKLNRAIVREARAVYGAQPLRPRPQASLPDDVARHVARGSRSAEFIAAGRHASADRLLRDVAAALVRRRALPQAADTYVSLGRLLLERGRAVDAEATFSEAAGHAASGGDEVLSRGARIWQAAARTDAAQLTGAESLCRAVLLTGGPSDDEQSRAEATLARVLIWQNRADEAGTLDFVAARHATPFVAATAVRVLLERGQLFEAGQRARQLLVATDSSSDPVERSIALTAHLRVLLAVGDFALAEAAFRQLLAVARDARSPLRVVRARLLYVDALRRAELTFEADEQLRRLERLGVAAPPLLRMAIDQRRRGGVITVGPRIRVESSPVTSAATTLVTLGQREDDDRAALTRMFEFTAGILQTSRIDLWSVDAGPASVVLSVGSGLPTRLGPRVADAGISIGPETGDPGHELGVPVRLGARLLAAIAVRWPADRPAPPETVDMLTLTAAVAAPRVESLLSAARAISAVAAAIPELVGVSAGMTGVRKAVARAAAAPFSVLIEGESGVGKELVARAIHHLSPRRERRFGDVNCAALPDELLESELFGHARGAFTGAVVDRAGLFEDADGGTLFLDEVVDLSARAQAKLLRVLQQQEVRRVGETFSRKVDVRIVSAANRDLRAEVDSGRFRQDLLYRLDVVRIRIPPLRERPEDVPLLAEHFWRAAAARVGTKATLPHPVATALSRYHWPGNVRELQNVIAALAVEAPARGPVRPGLLPAIVTGVTAVTAGRLAAARAQWERRFVEVALARAGGSRSRAARELGLSRQGLLKLMVRLGMG
jgi:DNA-binding NtrC family response regulator/tetratricopeptide (TPR) repeat protein